MTSAAISVMADSTELGNSWTRMRHFDVYRHPTHGLQAIKQGFSWPAFLFTAIWAFVKKLWLHGLIFVAVLFILISAEQALVAQGADGPALLVMTMELGAYIVIGAKGNEWRRADLRHRGYERIASLQASSPDAAIAAAASTSAAEESEATADKPMRRERN